MTDCSGNKIDLSNNQTDCSGNKIDMSNNNTKCTSSPSSCSDTNLFIKSSDCSSSYKNNNCCSTTIDDCCETSDSCSSYICSDSDIFCKKPGIDFSIGNKKCKKYKEGCKNVRCKINHHDSYVVNERKLINSMIDKYHNPNSICLKDNRIILKKLIPIYHDLIDITHSYIDKVHKLKFNLNPSKSSKIFRIVFDSFKTLTLNYYRSFTSILHVKYKGYDVLDFTMLFLQIKIVLNMLLVIIIMKQIDVLINLLYFIPFQVLLYYLITKHYLLELLQKNQILIIIAEFLNMISC